MNTSGEAADQVVRMSMEVGEAALKISGQGAKQLAVLLYAILKEQKKTKGRAKLETLVRSGKPLTVFSVKESDLKKFVQEAKRYGILYCAVRDRKGSSDGMVDIMVKEEDAPRINRIVERFRFASVTEAAKVKTEIAKSREVKSHGKTGEKTKAVRTGQEESPEKSQEDRLVDELLGKPVENKKQGTPEKEKPFFGEPRNTRPSGPISEKQGKEGGTVSKPYQPAHPERPSVREELKKIRAAGSSNKNEKKRQNVKGRDRGTGNNRQKGIRHRKPQTKQKNKKLKAR